MRRGGLWGGEMGGGDEGDITTCINTNYDLFKVHRMQNKHY